VRAVKERQVQQHSKAQTVRHPPSLHWCKRLAVAVVAQDYLQTLQLLVDPVALAVVVDLAQ
jgi:hypothetical protein